ncbi:MAG: DUF222 domain-containing protein [Jiangellaceae bacterium]
MFEDVVGVRDRLAALVDRLDPDEFSGSAARRWWAEFDRVERLAAAGKTVLARRIAETHQPGRSGSKTAAEELARAAGTSAGSVREVVDTSTRLAGQPDVDTALRRGELSASQVELVSAAAAANPAEEHRLVELAGRVSLAELREECARVKAAADPDPEATNRRLHAGRRLRRYVDSEGFWNLHARGTPQAGTGLTTVLDPIIDRIFTNARAQGRRESPDAYAFDALIHLAAHAAGHCNCQTANAAADPAGQAHPGTADAHRSADPVGDRCAGEGTAGIAAPSGAGADNDGTPGVPAVGDSGVFAAPRVGAAGSAGSGCAVRGSTSPRYLALLRVDVQALRRGHVQGGELCEISGVGPVPVPVAKGLLGEAIVKLVITTGVDVANVTHLGRGPTAAQKAALLWMNPTCAVQGCHRARVEWDHREPWAQTKHTRLDELDPLCSFHHDLKTRLGYALTAGGGKRAFVAPDDPRHPRNQNRAESGAQPSAATGRTASDGPPTEARRHRSTGTAPAAPPGIAGPPRAARQAAAQMTLPQPPAEHAPQPP